MCFHFDQYASYSDASTPRTPSPRTSISSDNFEHLSSSSKPAFAPLLLEHNDEHGMPKSSRPPSTCMASTRSRRALGIGAHLPLVPLALAPPGHLAVSSVGAPQAAPVHAPPPQHPDESPRDFPLRPPRWPRHDVLAAAAFHAQVAQRVRFASPTMYGKPFVLDVSMTTSPHHQPM
ncbi:hypothetical protein PHLGIDRAFT_119578 [Phlebiopsis gigantea 11061_1 CR5-6]|uniref:Uncharacterized protein n=1 Tax=Phlebiopsis gigantea (strain 11061_1 CR5-6) TaxID=745531 RepID=A0A0C3RW70_PHLG1|nr:hypothetical protein PHLGIDRAFT_119578 [Phlebiopsis gigantea 11061_1 CR5-6]